MAFSAANWGWAVGEYMETVKGLTAEARLALTDEAMGLAKQIYRKATNSSATSASGAAADEPPPKPKGRRALLIDAPLKR